MSLTEFLASGIAAMHIAYFLFLVGGCVALVVGTIKGREWIRNPWFRISHFFGVYVVLVENVVGLPCPLTIAEGSLRAGSPLVVQAPSAAGRFLDVLLFQTIPGGLLNAMYWVMAVIVVVYLFVTPIRFRRPLLPSSAFRNEREKTPRVVDRDAM